MGIEGMRVAILVEDEFEDSDVVQPLKALREAGADVFLVGSGSKGTYTGKKRQTTVHIDRTADEVKASDFDGIVIPGGHAPDKMRLYQAMVKLVREASDEGRIVAAVCHGPQLLISAGIIKGKSVTCSPSIAIDVENAGATYVDQAVVRDGNLITSRKPDDLLSFNRSIIEALEQRKGGKAAQA